MDDAIKDLKTRFDVDRRTVLGGALLGAIAASLPAGLRAETAAATRRLGDTDFWSGLRERFTLNPEMRFMNIGTAGSMTAESLDVLDRMNRESARESLNGYGNHAEHRAVVAAGMGADPDEIAISGNTSDGMCIALQGLTWAPGDEIVTTNHEHPGGDSPMRMLRDRYGVVIKRITVPVGNDQKAEDYVDLFAREITPRTRAIVFSSPTYKTGTLLPVRMIAELAQDRGIVSILDGAHLPGMMAIDCHELGVDFMAAAAHKWQCGPLGTGILYVRNKVLPEFNAQPLPAFFPITTSSYPEEGIPARTTTETETDDIAGRIQSCGSRNAPAYAAVANVCGLWDRIGRRNIEDYVLSLSANLKEKLAAGWGVDSLYAPKDDDRLVCALTSFNPFRDKAMITSREKSDEFVRRMRDEHNFIVRNVGVPVPGAADQHWPIRISTHLWSDMNQIDHLVAAMEDVAQRIPA